MGGGESVDGGESVGGEGRVGRGVSYADGDAMGEMTVTCCFSVQEAQEEGSWWPGAQRAQGEKEEVRMLGMIVVSVPGLGVGVGCSALSKARLITCFSSVSALPLNLPL